PDYFGTKSVCPECKKALVVPMPKDATGEAANMAARILALGYSFAAPQAREEEELAVILETFSHYADNDMERTIAELEVEELLHYTRGRLPKEVRLKIGNKMLKEMLAVDSSGELSPQRLA